MSKISVISNTHLLPETQESLRELLNQPIEFPDETTQPDEQKLIERTADAEIVLASPGTKITALYLDSCPTVKYVGICGTAMENVDQEAIASRNIDLTNVSDYGDEPTAEFIFMQLEYLARGMGQYQWKDYPTELMGKTIGIIGLGALGKAIAHLALAYKMKVFYYSKNRKSEWEEQGVKFKQKAELLQESDIIVVCTPSNMQAIENNEFSLIQPNSILVQASMGSCFDRSAFLEWIKKNNNFALFDYAAGEDNYKAYSNLPNVIFPKIIAGHTHETRQRLGEKVIANLKEYLNR